MQVQTVIMVDKQVAEAIAEALRVATQTIEISPTPSDLNEATKR